MLEIKDLNTYYGAIHALKGINLVVNSGEIVAMIGSNGAGKTTLVNSVIGLLKAAKGEIYYKNKNITNIPAHNITNMKISISPEGREVFPDLSVEDNLRLGAYTIKDNNVINSGYSRVYALFPRLKERYKQPAGTLSGGEQQMLAVGRALMSNPELLLLDEPSLGLAPNFVAMIFDMIKEINKQGVTVLLIEQNANMALSISDRAYVIENGLITMSGTAGEIAKDSRIKKAYLGVG